MEMKKQKFHFEANRYYTIIKNADHGNSRMSMFSYH